MKLVNRAGIRWDSYYGGAAAVASLLAGVALAVLPVRAAVRLDSGWDGLLYHIPFAARRAGMRIPFEMSDRLRGFYAGFPPLPEIVQGILWRATGSINATGLVNYVALVLFLYFCHRKLGAPFSIVAIVSLTAPLVLIHATTSYVDLFANALLAIGTSSLVAMYLFDRFGDRSLLLWCVAGLAGAAWSKILSVPIVAVAFVCLLLTYGLRRTRPEYRGQLLIVVIAMLVASAPYVKNMVFYHNPFWPVRVPVVGDFFPYTEEVRPAIPDRALTLRDASQFKVFWHSLLEIHHPTHYSYRERWIVDQGQAWVAYRMGGFWNVAVVTANAVIAILALLWDRRKGTILLASMAALLLFMAVLPQSNELRYHQFLPLMWAATIGMLLPRVRRSHPAIALAVLSVVLAEFVYVSGINIDYYKPLRRGYLGVAQIWEMPARWAKLDRSKVYCAVGFAPATVMLTGPTMSEFHIIEGTHARDCPADATFLKPR